MNRIIPGRKAEMMYYVYGSGLMPVPNGRINEIPTLKREFHANEVRLALAAARTRKVS